MELLLKNTSKYSLLLTKRLEKRQQAEAGAKVEAEVKVLVKVQTELRSTRKVICCSLHKHTLNKFHTQQTKSMKIYMVFLIKIKLTYRQKWHLSTKLTHKNQLKIRQSHLEARRIWNHTLRPTQSKYQKNSRRINTYIIRERMNQN